MQIRRRKHHFSLVRSVYEPARKRCRAVTVGCLPVTACEIPAELRMALTETEIDRLERLVAANRGRHELDERRQAAFALPTLLREVAAWYRSRPTGMSRRDLGLLAEASRAQWTDVLAAMCVAGVGRTRKRRKSAS